MKNKTAINVFFTFNDRYTAHAAVAIASMLKNAADDDNISIHILSSDLSQENKNIIEGLGEIKRCAVEFINVDDGMFKKYKTPDYINSSASLYRYLIPNVRPKIDKALYLDCDIVVKGSLCELFDTDLKDNYIAGVEDFHWGMCFKRLKLNSSIAEPYFNSGVLLLNCKKMREDDIFEKLVAQTEKLNPKMLEQTDQDAINIVCAGKKLLLHPKYNLLSCYTDASHFTSYGEKEMKQAAENPVIIHYTTGIKPWIPGHFPLNEYAYEYHRYLRLTPFCGKKFRNMVSVMNPKVKKSLEKLRKNAFLKTVFDFFGMFVQIGGLIKGLLRTNKYKKDFIRRTRI
ncbi:MAG: glycosyltransferase family 8 protein [Rickettsiales bacterium]|jgi:lipopolysaccharide biosynthesis glycosyltransferase|nr:glycosyltransferase family 8 protein [Rickettsiales bacterium]